MNLKELLNEKALLEEKKEALYASIEPKVRAIDETITKVTDQITALTGPLVKMRRDAEGKPYGIINVEFNGVRIKHDQPKKVKWNESMLASIVERIKSSNADPSEYVKINYKVEERKYGAWPQSIKEIFEPARTTELGAVKVSFEIIEDDSLPMADNVIPMKARA